MLHHDVTFRQISPLPSSDSHLEYMSIIVQTGELELTLTNVYIPPVNSIGAHYHPCITQLLQGESTIIMGDFNAHHPLWFSELPEDNRGTLLVEQIDDSTFSTINDNQSTRVTNNCSSSPDITLASTSLLHKLSWEAVSALSSDHLPIVIKVDDTQRFVESEERTFMNNNKADWINFAAFVDNKLSQLPLPTDAISGEQKFRSIVTRAAQRFIPKGRIKYIIPCFPPEAARLARRRDQLRRTDPTDPNIVQLTSTIHKLVNEHRRTKWLSHIEQCPTGSKKLWTTIRGISGKTPSTSRTAITFNDQTFLENKKCATQFNRQFVEHPSENNKLIRPVLRKLKALKSDLHGPAFSSREVLNAIGSAKASKALGPDGISTLMLKKLLPSSLDYLTEVYNLVVEKFQIPSIWKIARIVPIPKPGKPQNQGPSFRPISLLSPVAKILESLLLPQLQQHLSLKPHQHGFRKRRSTTTALTELNTLIADGLNHSRLELNKKRREIFRDFLAQETFPDMDGQGEVFI